MRGWEGKAEGERSRQEEEGGSELETEAEPWGCVKSISAPEGVTTTAIPHLVPREG